jgi:signal peptidase II
MTAAPERSYRWLFWTIALLGLCLDQGSKYGIFACLRDGEYEQKGWRAPARLYALEVVPGMFQLDAQYLGQNDPGDNWRSPLRTISAPDLPKVNTGALWGIGSGEAEGDAGYNFAFALVSIAAAIGISLWSFRAATAADRWLCLALGLLLAGTIGNLYDRIIFLGVRDFLHFHWHDTYHFPVFNIADSCLVCGASLMLLQAFLTPSHSGKPTEACTADAAQQTACIGNQGN